MLQAKTTQPNNQNKSMKLPQKIPITYLWFGKTIPEDYLISLSELQYPFIFIKDAELDRNFSRQIMDIKKSDYYRLQYLYQHGGIYSDLDNIIDYTCLMNLLKPYRNQDKLVFMTDGKHTRAKIKQMTNNLIFAPYTKMPILKKMLDDVNEKKGKIWNFAGMRHVAKYSQPLEVNMDKCVKHIGDWSWFAASNKVLGKNTSPNDKFKSKLTKKKDILRQNSNLYQQIKNQKQTNNKLNMEFNKLTFQYKKVLEELNNLKKNQIQKNVQRQNKKQTLSKNIASQKPQTQIPLSNDFEWTKEKLTTMQNQIQHLALEKNDFQFERNGILLGVGGSIIILLILILIGLLMLIKNKKRIYNEVEKSQRSIIEVSKIDDST